MSEANLYAPPKTKVESDPKLGTHDAYRDGGQLIVKAGFVGPKVCVVTGLPVEEGVKPMKVPLKSTTPWKDALSLRTFLLVLSNSMIFPIFKWLEEYTWALVLYVVWLFVVGRIYQSGVRGVQVYCHKELDRSLRKRRLMNYAFTYIGFYAMIYAIVISFSPLWIGFGLLCIIASILTASKALLKSVGAEGEYEQFEGAHYLFLEEIA